MNLNDSIFDVDSTEVRNGRQIPVISDIERIKKVVEFLGAVGQQVNEKINFLQKN